MLQLNKLYNMDCMEGMKQFPDKYFDLAIVDPPYGGGSQIGNVERERERERERESCTLNVQNTKEQSLGGLAEGLKSTISVSRTGGTWAAKYSPQGGAFSSNESDDEIGVHFHGRGRSKRYAETKQDADIRSWDVAPSSDYFEELARVSKNQIIWGGNYFALPPTRCFVIWRKLTISENFTMAMCEYAWTSFNENAKLFECAPQGNKEKRFHPTQKPIKLYHWLLNRYAKPGDKILDTHVGSASSLIACYDTHHDFVGFEIDKFYYEKATERMEQHFAQIRF